MFPAERLAKIVEFVNRNGSASIEELTEHVYASQSTVRRDLADLAEKGLLVRTHGGAVANSSSTTFEPKAFEKHSAQIAEKNYVGRLAAEFISHGESIILDSGTTTLAVAHHLGQKENLTLITHDIRIALETKLGPHGSLVVAGGIRRNDFDVLVGSETENFYQRLSVDKAFVGVDAVSFKRGITNATFAEVSIKQSIIKAARQVIVVADHTKFNKTALVQVASLTKVDRIITDSAIDPDLLSEAERLGIRVSTSIENSGETQVLQSK